MAWQLFLNFCIVWNITHAWSLRSVAAVVSCYWFIVSGLGHCFCCLFYPSLAEHSISSRHSTSITTRALFFTMSLIYALLMAALDLAGIIFNLRMLRSCFRDKEKYTFLQKCRTLAISQCACQVLILLADAVDSWQGFETESRESCDVVRVLSSSMLFFQGCNLMAILIICFDQPSAHGNSELHSKLKVSAALSLGLIGSAIIWWYRCFSQDRSPHIFQMTPLPVLLVVSVAFVVLLFAWDSRNIIHDQVEDDPQEPSMEKCSLLWKVLQEYRRPVLFIFLLLVCLLVILSWSPRSAENAEALKNVLYSVITRFVVGIVLPVTFSDLIELSKQDENGLKTAFI